MRHWLVFTLSLLQQILSMIWYSPHLFGFKWFIVSGYKLSAAPNMASWAFYQPFLLSFSASVFLCYGMLWLWRRLQIKTVWQGFKIATIGWIVGLAMFTLVHHQFMQLPIMLTAIDTARDWLVFASSGAILAKWGMRPQFVTRI